EPYLKQQNKTNTTNATCRGKTTEATPTAVKRIGYTVLCQCEEG
ncbi:20319_t:CDS:1, partial [Cetraspora pellucida]